MARFTNQFSLGLRWLNCGWRLFRRNPWLLTGMGFCAAALFTLLTLIPFVGGLVIGTIAPIIVASTYLALDTLSRLKSPLPASLRLAAIKKSPSELLSIFRDEQRVIPAVVVAIIGIVMTILANILMLLVAGDAWTSSWSSLSAGSALAVLMAAALGFIVYVVLALCLIYAMPLAFLRHEPLIPSIGRSLKIGARHLPALLVPLAALLLPVALAVIVSLLSIWTAYLLAFTFSIFMLPIVISGLYCSYRTLFPLTPTAA